jgi:hypothetical protein
MTDQFDARRRPSKELFRKTLGTLSFWIAWPKLIARRSIEAAATLVCILGAARAVQESRK